MKKLLVIAVALAAVNAQATQARVGALANSPSLVDTQTVYNNPADIFALGGDYVTLEAGATNSTNATDGAEGMVVRTMGDAKMGLALGHDSANASAYAGGLRPAAFGSQQNPVEFTYGAKAADLNWAGTLVYSNYQDKVATGATVAKESSMGLRLGARSAGWDGAVRLGLGSTSELGNATKFTGTMALGANGGYQIDTLYVFGSLSSVGYKVEAAGVEAAKVTQTVINVGVETSVKKDGSAFMYGARLTQSDTKESVADTKATALTLPLWIAVEADAASWLTLRGSVTQSLQLLNNSKTEAAGTTVTEFAPGANDTTVALGAGLKFNKVTVDGSLAGSATGNLDGNSLLANLGMSYWF